jgi:biopolymer transport protein ExbD
MVTAPMAMQAGIVVSSSQVDAKEGKVSQDESIALRLTKDGIYLNNQPYALEALPPVIASKLKLKAEGKKVVTITSEDEVLHGVMVAVMDISKQAGAEGLSIMREPKLGKLDKSKKKKK